MGGSRWKAGGCRRWMKMKMKIKIKMKRADKV
jgi:hypothetical protein